MSSWIAEKRQLQDVARADLLHQSDLKRSLGLVFADQLRYDLETQVEEINDTYPEKFPKNSRSNLVVRGTSESLVEVRCGPIVVLTVSHLLSGELFKVMRWVPVGRLGKLKYVPDYYTLKIDNNRNLYLESKQGKPIPCEQFSRELLDYLTD